MPNEPRTEAGKRCGHDYHEPGCQTCIDARIEWKREQMSDVGLLVGGEPLRREIEALVARREAEARATLLDELRGEVEREPNYMVPEATPWRAIEGFRLAVLALLDDHKGAGK